MVSIDSKCFFNCLVAPWKISLYFLFWFRKVDCNKFGNSGLHSLVQSGLITVLFLSAKFHFQINQKLFNMNIVYCSSRNKTVDKTLWINRAIVQGGQNFFIFQYLKIIFLFKRGKTMKPCFSRNKTVNKTLWIIRHYFPCRVAKKFTYFFFNLKTNFLKQKRSDDETLLVETIQSSNHFELIDTTFTCRIAKNVFSFLQNLEINFLNQNKSDSEIIHEETRQL